MADSQDARLLVLRLEAVLALVAFCGLAARTLLAAGSPLCADVDRALDAFAFFRVFDLHFLYEAAFAKDVLVMDGALLLA